MTHLNVTQQFNMKHGAIHREFKPDEKVYVANNSHGKRTWVPGLILSKIGSVMYAVRVDDHVWRRHSNQIVKRCGEDLLNNIVDFFEIFQNEQTTVNKNQESKTSMEIEEEEVSNASDNESIPSISSNKSSSRPRRNRKPPQYFTSNVGPDGRYLFR